MFKFDVYFRNIEVINYFLLEMSITLLLIWYHTRHSLHTKIIEKLRLTVHKNGCCMYQCDVA